MPKDWCAQSSISTPDRCQPKNAGYTCKWRSCAQSPLIGLAPTRDGLRSFGRNIPMTMPPITAGVRTHRTGWIFTTSQARTRRFLTGQTSVRWRKNLMRVSGQLSPNIIAVEHRKDAVRLGNSARPKGHFCRVNVDFVLQPNDRIHSPRILSKDL